MDELEDVLINPPDFLDNPEQFFTWADINCNNLLDKKELVDALEIYYSRKKNTLDIDTM